VLTLDQAENRLIERNLTVIAAQRGIDVARAQRLVASSLPPMQASIGNTIGEFNETRNNGLQGARFHGPATTSMSG
jgi:cobalt-zinc-cadmium efflux system outer membrane protein